MNPALRALPLPLGSYWFAAPLRGFRSDRLRVRVVAHTGDPAVVVVDTADLLDAGTRLLLDVAKLATKAEA